MGTAVTSFSALAQSANHQVIQCDNPYHRHNKPHMLEMYALTFRGHHVSVTIDGNCYSVRIDRNPLTDKHDMSQSEAFAYVDRMTR
jgi:hypothetical protein